MANYVKPVVFKLGEQEYGVDIGLVNGIEKYQPVVTVPNSVPFIRGIINLREEVIPVYDLRRKFNMPEYDGNGVERKMIVIRYNDISLALEVDAISEIHDFNAEDIVSMPKLIRNDDTKMFERVANSHGRLIVLIDVKYLLTDEELEGVKKMKEDLK